MKGYGSFIADGNVPCFSECRHISMVGELDSNTFQKKQGNPDAFLWIPDNCKQVKAVVVSQQNMCEETLFDHPRFREAMSELDFGIIWIAPGIDYQWDVTNGCQEIFDKMLSDLADISGYHEIRYAPIVPFGHSAMATFHGFRSLESQEGHWRRLLKAMPVQI